MSTRIEDELRAAFQQSAGDLPRTTDPWGRTRQAVARARTRRRAAVAGALAVLLGVVVLGVTDPWPARRAAPPAERTDRQGFGPVVTSTEVLSWPTRGSLVGDPVVDQARKRLGDLMEVGSIPYAGTVGDLSVVIAAGREHDEADSSVVRALVGPRGRPVSEWTSTSTAEGGLAGPVLSVAVADAGGRVHLVVLTPSRDSTAAYSSAAVLAPDGGLARRFTPLVLDNGVGTAGLDAPTVSTVSVRTTWDREVSVSRPTLTEDLRRRTNPRPARPELFAEAARVPACRGLLSAGELRLSATPTLTDLSLGYDDLASVTPVWCRGKEGNRTALVAFTLTDGRAFQNFFEEGPVVMEDGTPATGSTGFGPGIPVPPGRELDQLGIFSSAADERDGYTISARGAATVRVEVPARVTRTAFEGHPDADGYLPFPAAQNRRVREVWERAEGSGDEPGDPVVVALAADGRVLGRIPFRVANADPYGLEVDGPVDPAR